MAETVARPGNFAHIFSTLRPGVDVVGLVADGLPRAVHRLSPRFHRTDTPQAPRTARKGERGIH